MQKHEDCRVSVIIPVYRAEKTLRKCVESLLFGEVRRIQIILVDDCSPDGSWQECLALEESYPQVLAVQNAVNSGVSYTRNRGIEKAEAEYVLFVDSDDWVSGAYVSSMLEAAGAFPDALPVCGYTLHDLPNKRRAAYLYDAQPEAAAVQEVSNLFDLEKKVLIQQLWNKVFRREIIEAHRIRFDESLSMGEDFLFVLDYMKAAGLHRCVVLNRPLYFYIRANQTSLMSKWVEDPLDQRMKPYGQMAELMEDRQLGQAEYALLRERLQANILYQIAASKGLDPQRKKQLLARHRTGEKDRRLYRHMAFTARKEQILGAAAWLRRIPIRLKAKIRREYIYPRKLRAYREKLRAKDFTLICQNCIGGVFYHEMGMQFLSPTINMFIREPDFVRFVGRLDYYLGLELSMTWEEEYPVGYLDDVRIDFMHYDTCTQAKEAWMRRVKRINPDRIVVIATDRNGFDDRCFEQWTKLPYKKILYTANPAYAGVPGVVLFPECTAQGQVDNIIDRKAFYRNNVIFDVINSLDETST